MYHMTSFHLAIIIASSNILLSQSVLYCVQAFFVLSRSAWYGVQRYCQVYQFSWISLYVDIRPYRDNHKVNKTIMIPIMFFLDNGAKLESSIRNIPRVLIFFLVQKTTVMNRCLDEIQMFYHWNYMWTSKVPFEEDDFFIFIWLIMFYWPSINLNLVRFRIWIYILLFTIASICSWVESLKIFKSAFNDILKVKGKSWNN